MGWVSGCRADNSARPRVIRGTRTAPLPLLPSGPGGVCSRPLHEARDLTSTYRNMAPRRDSRSAGGESGSKARCMARLTCRMRNADDGRGKRSPIRDFLSVVMKAQELPHLAPNPEKV